MPVNTIAGLFAKSPLQPLQKHMDTVDGCCHLLAPFLAAACQGDWTLAASHQRRIAHLAHEASQLKRGIRLRLPHGILIPLPRNELLELLRQQDRLGALALELTDHIQLRHLAIPRELGATLLPFLDLALEATALATQAIHELEDLLETGFRSHEVADVVDKVERLDAIDEEVYRQQIHLRQQLQAMESVLNPVDVMVLYQVIALIAELATQSNRIGARLEMMLSHH